MPHYFFDVRNDGIVPDMVGKQLASDDAARTVAWELASRFSRGPDARPHATLTVTDENGRTVCEVKILG
jgi:hypothetical protein